MRILLLVFSLFVFLVSNGVCFGEQAVVVEKKLTSMLEEIYGPRDIQVKLDGVPSLLKQAIKVRSVSVNTMPDVVGKGLALMEFEGEDGRLRSSYIPFRVYEKKKLFYARRTLQRGSSVSTDDVASKEAYVSESDLLYPKNLQELSGKMLKRDVSPGTVFTTLILDSPQVIRRGEMVTIMVENRQFLVKAKGRAEEPGKVGEIIRVKNLSSDREVVGRVAGDGTVIVEF